MAVPMHYETRYEWSGAKDQGGTTIVEGNSPLPVGGADAPGRWSPEQMLLAATEVCLISTLLSIASLSKLTIREYRSSAEGDLTFVPKEGYKFEHIVIRPVVTVAAADLAKAKDALGRAHRFCLVARSLNFPVDVEPEFVTV